MLCAVSRGWAFPGRAVGHQSTSSFCTARERERLPCSLMNDGRPPPALRPGSPRACKSD